MIFEKLYNHDNAIFTSVNTLYSYIPIPKNSSTLLRQIFINMGYTNKNTIIDNERVIICLRDPIDRWFSGITEYVHRHYFETGLLSKLSDANIKKIFKEKIYDEHTYPQTYFLPNNLNLDNTIFFDNKRIVSDISDFYLNQFGTVLDLTDLVQYRIQDDTVKINIMTQLKSYYDTNTEIKYELLELYNEDYKLIENATVYNVDK